MAGHTTVHIDVSAEKQQRSRPVVRRGRTVGWIGPSEPWAFIESPHDETPGQVVLIFAHGRVEVQMTQEQLTLVYKALKEELGE